LAEQIKVSLHLGPHKTATTHFQAMMRDNRDLLVDGGVRFYGPDYLRYRDRTLEKMFGVFERARTLNKRNPEEQLKFLAKGARRILFSEENFMGPLHDGKGNVSLPLYPEASSRLEALRERIPDVPLRLFLSMRRPDQFLQSAYSQSLLSGVMMSPEKFRRRNPLEEVDWVDLVDRVGATKGHDGLYLWQYEAYESLVRPLTRPMIGWGFARKIKVKSEPLHQGLSAAAVEQILEWNDIGRKGDISAEARKKYPASDAYPKFQLYPPEVSHAAAIWYDAQLEEIRERNDVTLVELRHRSDAEQT